MTLVELMVAMSILALVLLAFSSAFAVMRDRQSTSTAQTDLRAQASAALDTIARELADSAPGYVDTVQRSPSLGSPAGTPSDIFEDPLGGDPSHPRRQALNCTNTGGVVAPCRALTPLASGGAIVSADQFPGAFLGPTNDAAHPFQGIALTPQMAPRQICPFCGFQALEPSGVAYSDVLLFLVPRDVDHGGWQAQLTTDGSKPVYSAIVVYAPWIDDQGAGSLKRYTLSWSAITALATSNPAGSTLAACLDGDSDGVLFPTAPVAYDMGTVATNWFVLENTTSAGAAPLNAGRPSIRWEKGRPGDPEHAIVVFDRETGTAHWDIRRTLSGGTFSSKSPAQGVARVVRTLASGPGFGCCDFAATGYYSSGPYPVTDSKRVRVTLAVGRSFASGIRSNDAAVAVGSRDVLVRNSP